MVFFLFLASVIVLRRIVGAEKLSPVEVSPDMRLLQPSPAVASSCVAGDLSQLSSVLSQWGEGASTYKESSVAKDSVKTGANE